MSSFGQRLTQCRKARGLTQAELARRMQTNHSILGKYERDQVRPSIDVVVRLTEELETTVSYLLGEVEEETLLKDPVMLERLKTLHALPEEQRRHILYALDAMLRDAKTSLAYSL